MWRRVVRQFAAAGAPPAPQAGAAESWAWPVTVVMQTSAPVRPPIDTVESGHKEPRL